MSILIFSCLAILLAFNVTCFSGDMPMDENDSISKDCVVKHKRKRKERDYEMPVTVLKRINIDSICDLFREDVPFKSLNDLDTVVEKELKTDDFPGFDDISPNTVVFSPTDMNAAVQGEAVHTGSLSIVDQSHVMDVVPGVVVKKVTLVVPGEKENSSTFAAVKDYDEAEEDEEEDLMALMKKFSIGLSDSRNQEDLNTGIDFDPELED